MNAYQHLQAIAKAIKASEAGQAYHAHSLVVWSAAKHTDWTGWSDMSAPALVWEDGPEDWGSILTGWNGERLGVLQTDDATRKAYAALRADGLYLECSNSFILAAYPA